MNREPHGQPGWRRRMCAGLLLAGAAFLRAGEQPPALAGVLTITPFQTATFVADREAAQLLDGLAEFSTRLLLWSDTPRAPVTTVNGIVKAAFLPFVEEWRGTHPGAPRLTAAVVLDRVSDGYRALESPRIVRISIGAEISAAAASPLETAGDSATPVPFVVSNTRETPVTFVLRDAAGAAPLRSLKLKPHQALGFFLNLPPAGRGNFRTLVAQADGLAREFALPVRRHESATLRVKVIDETGTPTPARIYLTAADGRAHAPKELMQRIVTGDYAQPFGGDCYFHANGGFALELPAGPATLEVVRGFECFPVQTTVQVTPGDGKTVEIRLRRKSDLARAGWFSGDVHVHANLFAEKRIAPRDVLLVAQAEDLNVVNVLPCNDPRTATITDRQFFTGGPDAVSEGNFIVHVGEEMRNDLYGHVGFLNLKSFVEPAYFGWPHSPFPHDYPGNFPQAAAAKAQGGVVTYVHPGLPSEFPVDIALGVADTIDTMSQNDEEISTGHWYRLLNCGFRCPVSAGTDSFLNIPCHLIPGAGRVYVHTGSALTYAGWIEGYRRGRSFATNGPLLRFTVNGREAGEEIRAEKGPLTLEIEGAAESIVPMDSVEIIVNGRPVRRIAAGADKFAIHVAEKLEIAASSWVALRVRGPGHRLVPNDREVYAHTSPVYLTIGGRPVASREDALFFVRQIDDLIDRMGQRGVFASAAQKDGIVRRFHAGQDVYRRIAAEAAP